MQDSEIVGLFNDRDERAISEAKSKYGAKTFNAALFPDRPYTEYKCFVLRNSGNDCMWTRLVDGFESRLMDAVGINVVHQAWQP